MSVSPSVNVHFQGVWTADERSRLCNALAGAERTMPEAQKKELDGVWLTRATGHGGSRYIVLHRPGMGKAFAGRRVEEIIEQVRQRWGDGSTHA